MFAARAELAAWIIIFLTASVLSLGAYGRNSLWKDEVALWKDCVKKSPRKERPFHNLGYAYYELGKWEDAERAFRESLRLNPRYALSLYNLGLVEYQQGFFDRAIDHYLQAIALDPRYPDSHYNLGLAYYRKGLHQDALDALQKVAQARPGDEKVRAIQRMISSRKNIIPANPTPTQPFP